MLKRSSLEKRMRNARYVIVLGFIWLGVNILIAQYVPIKSEQAQMTMTFSTVLSFIFIIFSFFTASVTKLGDKLYQKAAHRSRR